ncbi:hypothetical protein [Salinarimonas sp.]
MNLSPAWAEHLAASGHDAVHWSRVGYTARARLRVLPLVNRSQSDSSNG